MHKVQVGAKGSDEKLPGRIPGCKEDEIREDWKTRRCFFFLAVPGHKEKTYPITSPPPAAPKCVGGVL